MDLFAPLFEISSWQLVIGDDDAQSRVASRWLRRLPAGDPSLVLLDGVTPLPGLRITIASDDLSLAVEADAQGIDHDEGRQLSRPDLTKRPALAGHLRPFASK